MPENIIRRGEDQEAPAMRSSRWVSAALVVAIVAIFALCFVLAPRPEGTDAEPFGGTDAAVTQVLEERGVEPWFSSLFSPDSSEVESGLFALQAALWAGVLGYALGNLRGRRAALDRSAPPVEAKPPSQRPGRPGPAAPSRRHEGDGAAQRP